MTLVTTARLTRTPKVSLSVGEAVVRAISDWTMPITTMPVTDRLHGTLDALVLKSLSIEPRHGFGILRWIAERTDDVVRVEEGSLYPALYRMERDGWLIADWGVTDVGRRAKFYSITAKVRRQLTAETRELATFIAAITPVLLPA